MFSIFLVTVDIFFLFVRQRIVWEIKNFRFFFHGCLFYSSFFVEYLNFLKSVDEDCLFLITGPNCHFCLLNHEKD